MSDHEHQWQPPTWDLPAWGGSGGQANRPRLPARCGVVGCGTTLAWEPPWYVNTITIGTSMDRRHEAMLEGGG